MAAASGDWDAEWCAPANLYSGRKDKDLMAWKHEVHCMPYMKRTTGNDEERMVTYAQ